MWEKISPYFKRSEFKCNCGECGQDTVDGELLLVLNEMREDLGFPVVIESGNRCLQHNRNIGGATYSLHVTGKAADVRPLASSKTFQEDLDKIYTYLLEKYPNTYGIARGSNFVHIDVRDDKPRRWTY